MKPLACFLFFILLFFSVSLARAGDESWINEDLKNSESDVYTLRAGTHVISDQIIVPEGKTMQGEVSESGELLTTIFLEADSNFDNQVPLVALNDNCKVLYIDFNGNSENQKNVPVRKNKQTGNGYHNFIGCKYKDNIEVAYCNFYNNLGDGLRLHHGKNISFHDNTGTKGGHDICFIVQSENVKVFNNFLTQRVNSAIRFMDVNNGQIFNNTIVMTPGLWPAGPAIQIQNDEGPMNNIEVFGNTVYNSCGPDIWLVGKPGRDSESIHIFFNVFYNGGWNSAIPWPGGIIASGFDNALIENNVWDGAHMAAVSFWAYTDEWALPATATLDSNIFINSVPGGSRDIGGWGINNEISKQNVISANNCFWDNEAGPVNGCEYSDSDIFINPKENNVPCAIKWDGERWVIPGYEPIDFVNPPSGAYDNIDPLTDEELEEFEFDNIFDVLEMEFTETANIEQEDTKAVNPEWEKKGKYTEAYIYLAGFEGQITIHNETYINEAPADCAIILTDTKNLASRPAGQTSTLKLSNGADNSLIAKLTVKTTYKVKEHKEISVLGHSVKVPYYKEKSEKVTFKKTFTAPDKFPVVSEEDLNISVRYFNNTYNPHTLITIEPKQGTTDVFREITYNYNGSTATDERYLGYVSKQDNGFKTVDFEETNEWTSNDEFITYRYQGCYIPGPLDPALLSVNIATPYNDFTITNFEIEEIGDLTEGLLRKLLILVTVLGFLGMFAVSGLNMLIIALGGRR